MVGGTQFHIDKYVPLHGGANFPSNNVYTPLHKYILVPSMVSTFGKYNIFPLDLMKLCLIWHGESLSLI